MAKGRTGHGWAALPMGGEITPHHANYADAAIDSTSAVGIFVSGASPYGAMDMSGNVREWCVAERDQVIPRSGKAYPQPAFAVRGGSYHDESATVTCAWRQELLVDFRSEDIGFRIVAPMQT